MIRLLMNAVKRLMAYPLGLLLACSCAVNSTQEIAGNIRTTSQFGSDVSIKDCVALLPPYSYHEIRAESAQQWLENVGVEKVFFKGIPCETILYPSDGAVGATRFYFNKFTGKFWRQYYAWEPGFSNTLSEYELVDGKLELVSRVENGPPIP